MSKIRFKPIKIKSSELSTTPIVNGQFIILTDRKEEYLDISNESRVLLSDIIKISEYQRLHSDLPTDKFYFTTDYNGFFYHTTDGEWEALNSGSLNGLIPSNLVTYLDNNYINNFYINLIRDNFLKEYNFEVSTDDKNISIISIDDIKEDKIVIFTDGVEVSLDYDETNEDEEIITNTDVIINTSIITLSDKKYKNIKFTNNNKISNDNIRIFGLQSKEEILNEVVFLRKEVEELKKNGTSTNIITQALEGEY